MNNWFNFENVGEKIKSITKAIFWITSVIIWVACFIGLIIMSGNSYLNPALLLIPIGIAILWPLLMWVYSLFIYGFGEIISKLDVISANTKVVKDDLNSKSKQTQTNQQNVEKELDIKIANELPEL